MSGDLCDICGIGFIMPSGVCDHCDQPRKVPTGADGRMDRAAFLKLPMEERRAILGRHADRLKAYYDAIDEDGEEYCRPMRAYHLGLVVGALDTLACALADHGHQWTDGERAVYEEAIKVLTWKSSL